MIFNYVDPKLQIETLLKMESEVRRHRFSCFRKFTINLQRNVGAEFMQRMSLSLQKTSSYVKLLE
jgi:hypothetical protein